MNVEDSRYLENTEIAFAIYCDEHNLTASAGIELAELLSDRLHATAADREYQEGVAP